MKNGRGGGLSLDLGGVGEMVVLFCKKLPQLWQIETELFTSNFTNRVVHGRRC